MLPLQGFSGSLLANILSSAICDALSWLLCGRFWLGVLNSMMFKAFAPMTGRAAFGEIAAPVALQPYPTAT
jgi:hypothetical protein